MSIRPKWIYRTGATVLMVATVTAVGTAAGVYNQDQGPSPAPASATTIAGPACNLLPDNWEIRENVVVNPGGAADVVNPWAAGDAAAAAYFNELSRLCPTP